MPPSVHAPTRKAWRAWLRKHHARESEVRLVQHKVHTGKPAMSHREAMSEAICWGWIDTTIKRIDDDTFARTFRRRTGSARWSRATLRLAQELIDQGLMQPQGLQRYEEGRCRPVIDHDLPKNPDPPPALVRQLAKSKRAAAYWQTLAPSYRRYAIYMIENAKQIYANCRDGKKPLA
jgi:uncharacterized protein YdeI (YjbR/CyaY-like superfamily)